MLISEIVSLNQAKPLQQRKQRLPSSPIADPLKHERIIRKLTAQIMRQSNLPHATQDDLNAAVERCKTIQKRVDLEHEMQAKLAQQRHKSLRRKHHQN